MENIVRSVKHNHVVYAVYLIGFLFGLYSAIPAYTNSSFLSTFGSDLQVSVIYTLQSIAILIGFICAYPLIKRYGNYRTANGLIIGQILTTVGFVLFKDIISLGVLFVINGMLLNAVIISTDILVESVSGTHTVGKIRGFYFTFINLAWVISPSIASSLIGDGEYWKIYMAAGAILLPLLFVHRMNFRDFKDPIYSDSNFKHAITKFLKHRDFRLLSIANIVLNIFYTWMVIYMPIYLNKTIGLGWTDIGLILTVMLIPFVIMDAPLGKLADKYGEKAILLFGMIILAVSVSILPLISLPSVLLWSVALFMTRVGAASTEMMIETYFFKKIHTKDSDLLSIFRTIRPIAYLIGPILYTITIALIPSNLSFLVLGGLALLSVPAIILIKDKV